MVERWTERLAVSGSRPVESKPGNLLFGLFCSFISEREKKGERGREREKRKKRRKKKKRERKRAAGYPPGFGHVNPKKILRAIK